MFDYRDLIRNWVYGNPARDDNQPDKDLAVLIGEALNSDLAGIDTLQGQIDDLRDGQQAGILTAFTLAELEEMAVAKGFGPEQDGVGGTVSEDPDPAKNGSYKFNGTAWVIIGAGRLGAVEQATARITRKADSPLTFWRPFIEDRSNFLGGGPAIYVPRQGSFRNAGDGTIFTVNLTADAKLPDHHKVALSATSNLQVVYYDTVDGSVKVALAGTSNMPVERDRYFHLASLWGPTLGGGGGVTSGYDVQSTASEGAVLAGANQRAMVFDRSNYRLRVPQLYGYTRGTTTWTLSPLSDSEIYRIIDLPSSGALYSVWLDTWDLTVNGATSPTAIHVTQGLAGTARVNSQGHGGLILLGIGWNRWFSPCGIELATIVANQCGFGKEDNDLAEVTYSNCEPVDLSDSAAIALGLTRGWHSTVTDTRDVYYGGLFDEPIRNGTIFYRFFVESPSGSFGTPRALLFVKNPDGTRSFAATSTFALAKIHSANLREYVGIATVVGTAVYDGMWMGGQFGSVDCKVAGVAYAATSANNPWVLEQDYPRMGQTMGRRLRTIEGAVGNADLPSDPVIPNDLYMIDERRYPVYLDQMVRNPIDGRLRATVANVPSTNTGVLKSKEYTGGAVDLTGADGDVVRVTLHDRGGPDTINMRGEIALHVVNQSQVGSLPPISIHAIGDSLTDDTGLFVNAVRRMQAMGATVTALGTSVMSSVVPGDGTLMGEGRSGKEFADFIHEKDDVMLVPASVSAYNAASDSAKANLNPYIRPATGGDDPAKVYNGYIFDFAYYRTNYLSGQSPDVVWLFLGMNDMNPSRNSPAVSIERIQHGLSVMVPQIRAALPDALIVLPFPCYGRTSDNQRWAVHIWNGIQVFTKFVRDLADPNLVMVPLHCTMSRDAGYVASASVNPDTGVSTDTITDATHPGEDGVRQAGEVLAQTILAKLIAG